MVHVLISRLIPKPTPSGHGAPGRRVKSRRTVMTTLRSAITMPAVPEWQLYVRTDHYVVVVYFFPRLLGLHWEPPLPGRDHSHGSTGAHSRSSLYRSTRLRTAVTFGTASRGGGCGLPTCPQVRWIPICWIAHSRQLLCQAYTRPNLRANPPNC